MTLLSPLNNKTCRSTDKVSVNNEILTHFTPQAISRQANDFLKTENKNLNHLKEFF